MNNSDRTKNENIFLKIVNKNITNKILFVVGIFIILTYFGFYMIKQPIVDEEVRPEITNNLIPWEVKKGESFIKAMIERPFDLKITEYGQYRPRYLAFLVQFLDENLFLKITRTFKTFGNRQPFYILAMFLTVISFYYYLKNICKKFPKGLSFFISSSILLFQNYQVATYWRARSAKLLTLSACVFLITYVIKNIEIKFKKYNAKKIILSIPVFLLMTLDEQVLATVVFLTCLSILFSIIDKKLNLVSVITVISSILYASFHLWWGKALFKHFTGSIVKHGHTIEGSISGISLTTIFESLRLLKKVIPKLIFMSFYVFFIIWVILFLKNIFDKEKSKIQRIKETILALFLSASSIVVLMLMIDAHPAIYTIPCLTKSVYLLVPSIILLMSFLYLVDKVNIKYNYLKFYIIFLGIIISLVYNITHINSEYYGAYLNIKGGFASSFSDLIVTKNDIKTGVIRTKDFNIDNDNFIAVLNTSFASSNIKTTKVTSEFKNSKIENNFKCYLITKEKRKLFYDFSAENYDKIEKIVIHVNNDKYVIKAADKNIKGNLNISAERNRACIIRIEILSKTNESLVVNHLYMR